MILSVPPNVEPRRVSVDAIEHWMIYQRASRRDAILHVHAWMEGIAATDINYPCGTAELATRVAELIDAEPDPRTPCRPAQPRHHRHRRQPERDPRPDRAAPAPAGSDDLSPLAVRRDDLGRGTLALPAPPSMYPWKFDEVCSPAKWIGPIGGALVGRVAVHVAGRPVRVGAVLVRADVPRRERRLARPARGHPGEDRLDLREERLRRVPDVAPHGAFESPVSLHAFDGLSGREVSPPV